MHSRSFRCSKARSQVVRILHSVEHEQERLRLSWIRKKIVERLFGESRHFLDLRRMRIHPRFSRSVSG